MTDVAFEELGSEEPVKLQGRKPKGCACSGPFADPACPVHSFLYSGEPRVHAGFDAARYRSQGCVCYAGYVNPACPVHSRLDADDDLPPKARPDPMPKTSKRRGAAPAAGRWSDDRLVEALSGLLAMPAVPALAILQCQWCALHFANEAEPTARALVQMSRRSPGLRRALIMLAEATTNIGYIATLALYVGKPLAHHLAPNDTLAALQPITHVPPRPRPQNGSHASAAAAAAQYAGAPVNGASAPAGETPAADFPPSS